MHEFFMELSSKVNHSINLEPSSIYVQAKNLFARRPALETSPDRLPSSNFYGEADKNAAVNAAATNTARETQGLMLESSPCCALAALQTNNSEARLAADSSWAALNRSGANACMRSNGRRALGPATLSTPMVRASCG